MEEISKMVVTRLVVSALQKKRGALYVGPRGQGREPNLQYISYAISGNRGIRSLQNLLRHRPSSPFISLGQNFISTTSQMLWVFIWIW
jgi:hypothetical protein